MVKKLLELGTGMINYSEFLDLFNPLNEISYQPVDPTGLIFWDIEFKESKLRECNYREMASRNASEIPSTGKRFRLFLWFSFRGT